MSRMSDLYAELRAAGIDPERVDLAHTGRAFWQCDCGFMVDEAEYETIMIDPLCPNCHQHRYSDFHWRMWG
jgi:hypothetical protein